MAYQSNTSSLEVEDQGCSSMDSVENQASPLDSLESQSLPVNDSSLESYFEDDCSPCESNTPTNSLEEGQSSSNSQDSDTEVSGLDLVRMIFQTLLLYDCTYQRSNSLGGLRDRQNKGSDTKST